MENDLTGKRLVLGSVLIHVHWSIKSPASATLFYLFFYLRSQVCSVVSGILFCSISLQTALWWNCKLCDTIRSLLAHYSWVWLCRNTHSKFKSGITLTIIALKGFPLIYLSEFGNLFIESRFVLFLSWTWTEASIFHPPGDSRKGTRVTLGGAVTGVMMKTSVATCSPVLQHPRSP